MPGAPVLEAEQLEGTLASQGPSSERGDEVSAGADGDDGMPLAALSGAPDEAGGSGQGEGVEVNDGGMLVEGLGEFEVASDDATASGEWQGAAVQHDEEDAMQNSKAAGAVGSSEEEGSADRESTRAGQLDRDGQQSGDLSAAGSAADGAALYTQVCRKQPASRGACLCSLLFKTQHPTCTTWLAQGAESARRDGERAFRLCKWHFCQAAGQLMAQMRA